MSVENRNIQTSSSDESDLEKLPRSLALKLSDKRINQKSSGDSSNMKTYSFDSEDLNNISESGSEKESGASRDSDSSGVTFFPLPSRKRKTPEKASGKGSNDESSSKIYIKDNADTFLQEDACSTLPRNGKFFKCRECYKSSETNRYSCRFYSFRKMKYGTSKKHLLYAQGFACPDDAEECDRNLWLPKVDLHSNGINKISERDDFDFHVARFILSQVGDQFCSLMRQESEAVTLHMGEHGGFIAWKKPMKGVREMCDVCKTTLFNFHWACERCGFVVCIDCYKVRKNGLKKTWMVKGRDIDEWKWVFCTNAQPHEQNSLMLCQTIAGDCLQKLGQLVHDVREKYEISQSCTCEVKASGSSIPGGNSEHVRNLVKLDPLNAIINHLVEQPRIKNDTEEHEARVVLQAKQQILPGDNLLLSCSVKQEVKQEDSDSDSDEEEQSSSSLRSMIVTGKASNTLNGNKSPVTLPGRLTTKVTKTCSSNHVAQVPGDGVAKVRFSPYPNSPSKSRSLHDLAILDDCIQSVDAGQPKSTDVGVMQHFVRRNKGAQHENQSHPSPRMMTLGESAQLYPDVPHSWLCNGMLLRLVDPSHTGNYKLFQDQWRRGQPVIVGNMTRLLNMNIWHPNSFCNDFGDKRNDLVNCATGKIVPDRPMKEFWEGFENLSKRLKDEHGQPMLLKLKDWPPGEDFAVMLPERFDDLMQALPLAEYTKRTGRLNLASCLPDFFVRPDLGPKMYNAYGSALFPTKGTTNLHLDISDAVNFMVYVGIPSGSDYIHHKEEAYKAIDEAGCDDMTRRRVRLDREMPGALWHIYHAIDADKIRDLLNKVAIERGVRLEPHHDPIHDQSWYLDAELRNRLYKEYNVSGYAIVQCLGDAVFIPAGAPHQVRNLHNCVKVAEDFVSPENVSHCFYLTQEFRELSDTHTNHEDKLQIKNIIYHTIKSAVSTLLNFH